MLTSRDLRIIEFIERFGAANTKQITQLFFQGLNQPDVVARRRLVQIVRDSNIKRTMDPVTGQYIYYLGKKAQLQHKLVRTEFYCRLQEKGRVLKFEPEYTLGDVRADAFIAYEYHGKGYLLFLEVQICNSPVDIAKYERLYYRRTWTWPVFPRIVVASDKKVVNNSRLTVKVIPTNFEKWEECLK